MSEGSVLTPRDDRAVPALLALAERCENEGPDVSLDAAIECAINPVARRIGAGSIIQIGLHARFPKPFTSSLDAAMTLEPADAQEVCVRKYPNGGMYVRITLADGRPVYSESLLRSTTEPMARCAAALRARAAASRGEATTTQQGGDQT